MIEQRIQLNLIPNSRTVKVRCSQYDDQARKIIIELFNGSAAFTIPEGTTVQIRGTKPSGKGFSYSCTFSGNVITAVITGQMTVVAGSVCCEIILTNGAKTLGTANFILEVEKAAMTAGTIIDSDDFASIIKEEVRACANEKLIELEVDQTLDETSEKAISNKAVTAEFNSAKNNFANAIRGKLSGAAVFADDVSPVEHSPKIWVHGKNLLNIPDTVVEGNYAWCNSQIGTFELAPGTYTISADFAQQGADISKAAISARKYESITVQHGSISSTEPSGKLKLTFTIPDDEKGFTLYAYSNVTATAAETRCVFSNFQIESGSIATEYTPFLDASTVTLTRCGKAIFSKSSQVVSGVSKPWTSLLVAAVKVPPGDYVASCRFKQTGIDKSTVSMSIRTYNDYSVPYGDASSAEIEGNLVKQFTVTPGSGGFQIFLYSNTPNAALTTECSFENICVEAGTKATGYSVYNGAKYIPASDGTVPGVTSLSPYMTILTDTEGAIVECEYNRDTNKVIEKLFNAVIALGGTL